MVNPWYKYQNASKQKKQALHSLVAGLALFGVLYLITKRVSVVLCPVRNLFGIPCPGCGLTRAFIAILRLDLTAAVEYHALSIPIFLWILIYASLVCSDILLERDDLTRVQRIFKKPIAIAVELCCFAVFLYIRYF